MEMKNKRYICPSCGHQAYYQEEGERDIEGQQLEPDYSYCRYCGFKWEQYQFIHDEDIAYIHRKKLPINIINFKNIFYTISLGDEDKRRWNKYKCSWCGKYSDNDKCCKDWHPWILILND